MADVNPTKSSPKTPTNAPEKPHFPATEMNLSYPKKELIDELKIRVQSLGETYIYGVKLLVDERSDVILLNFLRARDFKVEEAFLLLKKTLKWRQEFGIDSLIEKNLDDDLEEEEVVFRHGFDKDGCAVCYNVYGGLYEKTFGDQEKMSKFILRRIQVLERSIRKLDFCHGGINTIFIVNDLKNSPGLGKMGHGITTKQVLQFLEDNYPEFVAKQVFINAPWWHKVFYAMISPLQRTKSKFVFASPAKTAKTLFKYIAPEQVPIQYGGLSVVFGDCNPAFTNNDPALEITIRHDCKFTVILLVKEKCNLIWESRVVGWGVTYSAEYVPGTEGSYSINIQKAKKMSPTEEPVIFNSFKITEFGKLLLTFENLTPKNKKLLLRYKGEFKSSVQ